jgi:hypothetical protein
MGAGFALLLGRLPFPVPTPPFGAEVMSELSGRFLCSVATRFTCNLGRCGGVRVSFRKNALIAS